MKAEFSNRGRKTERPSFFGSIHAALGCILVGDHLWLARLAGGESGIIRLDRELDADFDELRAARVNEDERLIAVAGSYDEDELSETLCYRTMAGEETRIPPEFALGHLFNHQTHHRGQAQDILAGAAVAPLPSI